MLKALQHVYRAADDTYHPEQCRSAILKHWDLYEKDPHKLVTVTAEFMQSPVYLELCKPPAGGAAAARAGGAPAAVSSIY